MADGLERKRSRTRRFVGHPMLRALHRDGGYLAVGLTCVYALSGIAVNHVKDWDPSFDNYERTHHLAKLSGDDDAIARSVLAQLHIAETPRDVYRSEDDQLDITFDKRSLHVTPSSGEVLEQGQEPRFFLRAANYLHLNRGKKAWTYAADAYAIVLLGLALSGMFMLPGRRGLFGRGIFFVLLGAAVPIAYVTLGK
ncbi:MAG TPA: hypothetical protein VHZ95_01815 [Polyangiales bacterium]|nr:hypothetical protein [Polyangiales bacterium]